MNVVFTFKFKSRMAFYIPNLSFCIFFIKNSVSFSCSFCASVYACTVIAAVEFNTIFSRNEL